jgi:hypothetical protein
MVPEKIPGFDISFTAGTNNGEEYVGLIMEVDPPFDTPPNSASIEVQDGGDIVSIVVEYDGGDSRLATAGPRKAVKVLLRNALNMLDRNEIEHTVLEADQNPAR